MKYRMFLIALILGMIVTGCSNKETDEISKIEISEKTEDKETVDDKDITEDSFEFSDLNNIEFYFGSGAGAWRTIMHVAEDGSFWGEYSDSDMGSIGVGYSNGTYYYCAFEGKFTKPIKVNDYTYSLGIAEISYANEPGTKEIIDEILHIYSMPYGIDDVNSLLLYLPGAPIDELPQEYLDWIRRDIYDKESKELPFYGIYNEINQNGFSSYIINHPIAEKIENSKEISEHIKFSLESEILTQTEMNTKSYELYELWDETLNTLWIELKNTMPEDEFQTLLTEQRQWIAEKEDAVIKAAEDVAGGSMEALVKNLEAASITEERVYELYNLLK